MSDSWAVSEEDALEAEAGMDTELAEAVEEEQSDARHQSDEALGLSEEQSDAAENEPAQIDRRPAMERFSAELETEARQAKPGTQEVDAGKEEDFQFFEIARTQAFEGIKERIDDALVNAEAGFNAEELHRATDGAERFFSIENPDYFERVETARYLGTHRIAENYIQQGHGKEAAYQAAANDVQNLVWSLAAQAVAQGLNPAQAIFNVANRELATAGASKTAADGSAIFRESQAEAKGGQQVKSIEAGQVAAKSVAGGTSKHAGAPDGESWAAREERLSNLYEDDQVAFHREYTQNPNWTPS